MLIHKRSLDCFSLFLTMTSLLIICTISACYAKPAITHEVVSYNTKDGWTIVGDLYKPAGKAKGVVILLHQRGGSAKDWASFCVDLQKNGYTALAIDARGTGRSTKGPGPFGVNAPWLTTSDITGAIHYLKTTHAILVGASYGANNALIYASEHPAKLDGIILLSPGKDYNGLAALPAAQLCNVPVSIFASQNDPIPQNGPDIIDMNLPRTDYIHEVILNGYAHGTGMLSPRFDTRLLVEVRNIRSYQGHKEPKVNSK